MTTTTAELLDWRRIARLTQPEPDCSSRYGGDAAGKAGGAALGEPDVRSRRDAIGHAVPRHGRVSEHQRMPAPCRLEEYGARSTNGDRHEPYITGGATGDADDLWELSP